MSDLSSNGSYVWVVIGRELPGSASWIESVHCCRESADIACDGQNLMPEQLGYAYFIERWEVQ